MLLFHDVSLLYVWEIISLKENGGESKWISGVEVHGGGNNILRKYAL